MAKSDLSRVQRAIQGSPKVYVIRGRRRNTAHKEGETPWFVEIFRDDNMPTYTTDQNQAQGFSSLISADTYVPVLDRLSPDYEHAVDVIKVS